MTEPRRTVVVRMTHRIDTPGLPPLWLRGSDEDVLRRAGERGPSVVWVAVPQGGRDVMQPWRTV